MTRATVTTGSEFIDQKQVIARLSQQRAEPLTLDWLLELAVLPLLPVPYGDCGFFAVSELRLELPEHLRLSTLSPEERKHFHATEHVFVVEGCQPRVHLVLFPYVLFESFKTDEFNPNLTTF
jgi:hypothetical protein